MREGEKCMNCRFLAGRNKTAEYRTCDYIGIMSRSRGCPPGDRCTKFEAYTGKQKPRLRMPPAPKKKEVNPPKIKKEKQKAPDCVEEYLEGAEEIRKFRKQNGLTQTQLAETLGVSTNLISKWENARRKPNWGILRSAGMTVPKDADGI